MWAGARQKCMSYNQGDFHFDLASLHNREENEFVANMMMEEDREVGRSHYKYPWIGLHKDRASSWDEAQWTDGSPVTFTNWAPNEPTKLKVSNYRINILVPSQIILQIYTKI